MPSFDGATADGFACRSFSGAAGSEHYITVTAPAALDLAGQIDALDRRYAEALQSLHIAPDSAVFRRIFMSDAANQAAQVEHSPLFNGPDGCPVAVSMVEQAPLPGGRVAMLAYHVTGAPLLRRRLAPHHVLIERNGLGHLWSTRLCAGAVAGPVPTFEQTRTVFADLIGMLAANGATLAENCVRTWMFVKDVDVFYQEMVDGRIAVFDRQGLTRDTHYIAATGIEGACGHRYDTVLMDAYSVLGLRPQQVMYLNDLSRLCETKDYGVTFERGTRIAYADRTHSFISGTASIGPDGNVMFVGDVLRQLDRALGNVDALLRAGGARFDDMTHLIVYLRDPAEYPRIAAALNERLPGLPRLIVRGPVCRPDWLVEVEGIAVAPHDAPALPGF
jgi:enamine deaminase RidA (YjgF/YER057c/UK114 family)